MSQVRIQLPVNFAAEDLLSTLQDNVDELRPALDLITPIADPRVDVHTVIFTSAELHDDVVEAYYDFEWSVYFGCDDMNKEEVEHDLFLAGKKEDDVLVFDIFTAPTRSTDEEF